MGEAYIVDGVRTPIGRLGGALATVRADDLAAHVLRALMNRHPQIDPAAIDDVYMGCANQAGEDNRNVARMALLLAGLPPSVPGVTINRLCASGMSAVVEAARAIRLEEGDLFLAGGIEHMTRAPFVLSKASRPFGRDVELYDTSLGWRFVHPKMAARYGAEPMGCTAENLVERYHIPREAQDWFAYRSHQKAAIAQKRGRLALEIAPIEAPQPKAPPRHIVEDEHIRPDTTPEALAQLPPAFRPNGTVTAGNSSGLNDGACALLLASEKALRRFNLTPKARLVSTAVVGIEPRFMGLGPVEASRRALQRAGLSFDDVDVIELNEAFAAQVLACLQEWGLDAEDPRLNPNGGAIALGHPLGMTGARLILTAAIELEQRQERYALCTLCVGVGQGMATIIERV